MPLEHAKMDQFLYRVLGLLLAGVGRREGLEMNPEQLISRSAFLFLQARKVDKTRLNTRPTTYYNP